MAAMLPVLSRAMSGRACSCSQAPAGAPHAVRGRQRRQWAQISARPVTGRLQSARPVRCRAHDTLYEVLGVSESATTKEIKAAYRKRAVKLHPDVNKAPDAKERFMECKTAYETLMDEQQRRAYDRSRKGFGGGFPGGGLGGDFGKDWDEFGRYARRASQTAQSYTYSDLVRDLDKEIESWQKERERKKGRRAESITDVLGDVADEFLDFLEQGLPKEQRYSAEAAAGGKEAGSAKAEADARAERARRTAEKAADVAAAEAKAAADRVQRREASVEDELAELKRKMGL